MTTATFEPLVQAAETLPKASNQATSSQGLAIDVRDVRKSYGKFLALDDVNLKVQPNEFLTLLGPSGSGKTSLLMALAGFVRPDAGHIFLGDRDVIRVAAQKRDIGMVFQNYALFPHMSVEENIAYPLKLRGVPAAQRAEQVAAALAMVQLDGYQKRRIDALSGGQRQRVALARATVFGPRVLLMDEPLSALDKKLREQMQLELRRLHKTLGTTTICVTHDQHEALTMSDRIAVMKAGRIVQVGSPDELYRRPIDAFVADFIGESTMLPVAVRNNEAYFDGCSLALRDPLMTNDPQALLVRPEQLFYIKNANDTGVEAMSDLCNRFTGVVTERVYEGQSVVEHINVADNLFLKVRTLARHADDALAHPIGARVQLGLRRQDTVLVKL